MRLDKHLINEFLWDGYSLEQIASLFSVEVNRVIICLQPEPMDRKKLMLADAMLRNNTPEPHYKAGFSKDEIRQSVESLPTKAQRMEQNGYYCDFFQWDQQPKRTRKEKQYKPLEEEELEDLLEAYCEVFGRITPDQRDSVNNYGLSITDYLQDLILESLNCGIVRGSTAIRYKAILHYWS